MRFDAPASPNTGTSRRIGACRSGRPTVHGPPGPAAARVSGSHRPFDDLCQRQAGKARGGTQPVHAKPLAGLGGKPRHHGADKIGEAVRLVRMPRRDEIMDGPFGGPVKNTGRFTRLGIVASDALQDETTGERLPVLACSATRWSRTRTRSTASSGSTSMPPTLPLWKRRGRCPPAGPSSSSVRSMATGWHCHRRHAHDRWSLRCISGKPPATDPAAVRSARAKQASRRCPPRQRTTRRAPPVALARDRRKPRPSRARARQRSRRRQPSVSQATPGYDANRRFRRRDTAH